MNGEPIWKWKAGQLAMQVRATVGGRFDHSQSEERDLVLYPKDGKMFARVFDYRHGVSLDGTLQWVHPRGWFILHTPYGPRRGWLGGEWTEDTLVNDAMTAIEVWQDSLKERGRMDGYGAGVVPMLPALDPADFDPYSREFVEKRRWQGEDGDWFPASGGSETPFMSRTGKRLLYVYQPTTGRHAYLDLDSDLILPDDEARAALSLDGYSAEPTPTFTVTGRDVQVIAGDYRRPDYFKIVRDTENDGWMYILRAGMTSLARTVPNDRFSEDAADGKFVVGPANDWYMEKPHLWHTLGLSPEAHAALRVWLDGLMERGLL